MQQSEDEHGQEKGVQLVADSVFSALALRTLLCMSCDAQGSTILTAAPQRQAGLLQSH